MPLILPGNVGSATAATGFNVANSLRFAGAARDTYLTATFGSAPTLATKNTISLWFKRSKLDTLQQLYAANGNTANIIVNSNNTIAFYTNSGQLLGPRLYRDPSAWMHFVFTFDSTQGTASNRFKVYINGVLETSFNNTAYPSQNVASELGVNGTLMEIGTRSNHDRIFEGYMAETAFVDGQALDATSFGEFDEDSGIWKPIDVSGLTFGTNGFYLDFEDSANLGNDANGGTDLTEVNLAATDQSTDTCTNNFATLNPLHSIGASSELSQGNLEYDPSGHHRIISTIAPSSGMWYAEVKGIDSPDKFMAGICYYPIPANGSASSFAFGQGVNADVGRFANDFGLRADGEYGNNNSYSSYMSTPGNNDIIGIYMDLDNYKLYFSLNGSLVSATGKDLTNNGEPYGFISVGEGGTFQWNFGNPSFALANTAITDDNGFGAFEYSPNITGDSEAKSFFALCTKNLAEYG